MRISPTPPGDQAPREPTLGAQDEGHCREDDARNPADGEPRRLRVDPRPEQPETRCDEGERNRSEVGAPVVARREHPRSDEPDTHDDDAAREHPPPRPHEADSSGREEKAGADDSGVEQGEAG